MTDSSEGGGVVAVTTTPRSSEEGGVSSYNNTTTTTTTIIRCPSQVKKSAASMPSCQGQEGGNCPNNNKKKTVKFCQGDWYLCEVCEYARYGESSTRIPEKKKEVKSQKKAQNECKTCNFTGKKNVVCSRCLGHICVDCSGLTAEQIQIINDEKLNVHWFCTSCNDQALKAVRTDAEIEEKCKTYFQLFKEEMRKEVVDEMNKVNTEVKILKAKIKEIETKKQETAPSQTTSESLKELEERANRKNNLVLMNVPESDSNDAKEREEHDITQLKKVFEALDAKDVDIKKCFRLGKHHKPQERTYPRLLKVEVKKEENKKEILKKAKSLKGKKGFEKIYINRDLTPLEQREQKLLIEELKKKRAEVGRDEKWIIRNGAVVKERN